jgi:hypothetical protein
VVVASSARFAEQAGKRGDGFEQQGVEAGLLVGGTVGLELSDGAAVLGLSGELAYPGGDCGAGEGSLPATWPNDGGEGSLTFHRDSRIPAPLTQGHAATSP